MLRTIVELLDIAVRLLSGFSSDQLLNIISHVPVHSLDALNNMGNYISTAQRYGLEAVKTANTELQSDLDSTRTELLNSKSNEKESQTLIVTLRTELDVSNARYALFKQNNQNTAHELEQTTAELKAEKSHSQTTKEERDRAIAKADTLQNEVRKLTSKTQNLGRNAQSMTRELFEARYENAKLSCVKATADDRAAELSVDLARLNQSKAAELHKVRDENAKLSIAKASAGNEVARLSAYLDQLKQSKATELREASDVNAKLSAAKASADDKVAHVSAQLHQLSQSYSVLEEECKLCAANRAQELADQARTETEQITAERAAQAQIAWLERSLDERSANIDCLQTQLAQCHAQLAMSRQHTVARTFGTYHTESLEEDTDLSRVDFSRLGRDYRMRPS